MADNRFKSQKELKDLNDPEEIIKTLKKSHVNDYAFLRQLQIENPKAWEALVGAFRKMHGAENIEFIEDLSNLMTNPGNSTQFYSKWLTKIDLDLNVDSSEKNELNEAHTKNNEAHAHRVLNTIAKKIASSLIQNIQTKGDFENFYKASWNEANITSRSKSPLPSRKKGKE